jgi:dihydropteroate synthase
LKPQARIQDRVWQIGGGRMLDLSRKSHIMGVLNVTPDSFSDGGRFSAVDKALDQARLMVEQGASIIDVGGESTRPNAQPVHAEDEQSRVLPVIEALRELDIAISIDTYRAETAEKAVAAGAHIINDVWGLQKDPDIGRVAAETGSGLIIMHTSRDRVALSDPIEDQFLFLRKSLQIAEAHGVNSHAIVLDPGFGFGKGTQTCVTLLSRLQELQALGQPLMVGASRKRFTGAVSGIEQADQRDIVTAAIGALARVAGASIFRVHDVAKQVEALSIADAVYTTQRFGAFDVMANQGSKDQNP